MCPNHETHAPNMLFSTRGASSGSFPPDGAYRIERPGRAWSGMDVHCRGGAARVEDTTDGRSRSTCDVCNFIIFCCYEEDLWPLAGHTVGSAPTSPPSPSGRWITVWLSLSSPPLITSPRLRVSLVVNFEHPSGRGPYQRPYDQVVGYPRASLDGQRHWRALRKGGRSDVVTLTPRCSGQHGGRVPHSTSTHIHAVTSRSLSIRATQIAGTHKFCGVCES